MLRGLFVAVALAGLAVSDVAWAGGGDSQGGSTPFCAPIKGFYCKSIDVSACAPMFIFPDGLSVNQEPVLANFFETAVFAALYNAQQALCPVYVNGGAGCGITGFQVIRQGGLWPDYETPPAPPDCGPGSFRVDLRVWYLAPIYQNQN